MRYLVSLLLTVLLLLAGCPATEPATTDTEAPAVEEPAAEEPAEEEPAAEEPAAEEPAEEPETEAVTETETMTETEGVTETEEMPADAEANIVSVELVSFEIRMPASLPAGPTTFEVTNAGEDEHNFEIEGQGIEQVFEANLQPGETQTLEVDLQPGEYTVYCPVGDHREQGMELTLTVTE